MTDEIEIGPTITPAQWAAENPPSVRVAATSVLNALDAAGEVVGREEILTSAVHILREALLDETTPVEPELTDASRLFVRAHKAHLLFNESLIESSDLLRHALGGAETPAEVTEAYLYILMRNDLASMNAGKAVAQGTHAANQMVFEAREKAADEANSSDPPDEAVNALEALLDEWEKAANGFGTCIVLSVDEHQMRATVEAAVAAGLHAGITHDPSYPLRDGASFHLIPLDTCGYVFAKKCDATPFVGQFPLMP